MIAEHKLPAIFHSGHSGIGTGMPGGAAEAAFKPEVRPLILKENAIKALRLR